jgi:hypothetical protein
VDRLTKNPYVLLAGSVALFAVGLLYYSQTAAFAWDEGFHLLTAQLISQGKRPYLDFFFPQTPLNAFWNAFWMRQFGDTWRTAHAVAALCTSGAVLLMAEYVLKRFPVERWRTAAAFTTLFAFGCNDPVFEFGPVGQAYGLCLLFCTAAFRCAVISVDRRSVMPALATGFFVAASAGSSLLTISVAPVLLLWILYYNASGSRATKVAAFVAGSAFACVPLFLLYLQSPAVVLFNVFQFNIRYRSVNWDDQLGQKIETLTALMNWSPATILGILALAGLFFAVRRSGWDRAVRAEFYLCGWLALALGVHISTASPTFPRYFLLMVPYLSVLSAAAAFWLGSRLSDSERTVWPALLVCGFFAIGLGKTLWDGHDSFTWTDMEKVAHKVDEVTPKGAGIWADEQIYFLTRRAPSFGTEHQNSHKLTEFPADFAKQLHIVTWPQMKKLVNEGAYATIEDCGETKLVGELQLAKLYRQKEEYDECTVYWDKNPSTH